MRQTAYLGLGSDVGRRAAWLGAGIEALATAGLEIGAVSSLWLSEPVGDSTLPWFVNCVVAVTSPPEPRSLLRSCHAVEHALGRNRAAAPMRPRTLDVDVLLYDSRVVETPDLTIPHPRMHLRRFVLEPLCEIAPSVPHPVMGLRVDRLLQQLDSSEGAWVLAPSPRGCVR